MTEVGPTFSAPVLSPLAPVSTMASQPDKQNGTLSVHTIRASGHVHRTNRPNTRLHPTTTPENQINPCNAGAINTGHSRTQARLAGPVAEKAYPGQMVWGANPGWLPASGFPRSGRTHKVQRNGVFAMRLAVLIPLVTPPLLHPPPGS